MIKKNKIMIWPTNPKGKPSASYGARKLGEAIEISSNYRSFEKKLFPPDLVFNPAAAIKRFNKATQIYGIDAVLQRKEFQKAREIWVSSVFLLAWNKMTKKAYWVKPEYGNAPDVYGIFFEQHPHYADADIQKIIHLEISEWRGSKTENLIERIQKKLLKKYPLHFWLVIYINVLGESINPKALSDEVGKMKPTLPVFIISSDASKGEPKHTLIGLSPYKLRFDFDLEREVLENKQVPDVIKIVLGRGHKIDDLLILPLEFPKID